ncbi:MAG TPA: O-antigen ligase family protein [Vicinamibacteria bacterium]|nr:O-antigen ligase family protein [Vicinamibacteria bacterium]
MTTEARSLLVPSVRPGFLNGESPFVYGIAVFLALVQISIAASQIVLAGLVVVWLYLVSRDTVSPRSLPYDVPFAAYGVLTIASAWFSFDPWASFPATKELLLLVVPYLLMSTVRKRETLESLSLLLVGVADLGALLGLWQFRFGDLSDINHRIHGFVGHYMTYAGLLMGTGLLALAGFLFSPPRSRHRWFYLASFLLIGVALVLSLTRSAWIGTVVAGLLLLSLKNVRLLLLVPLLAVAAAIALSGDVERRVLSFVRPDTSGWDRVYMLEAGSRIVENHPLLGVGPDMVSEVYPIYVDADAPRHDNPHLHNNFMQVAAERGIPALLAFLSFLGLSFAIAIRELRRARAAERFLAAGALAVLLAGVVAGLFEYNFGDSEFQMLFLFAVSIPPILRRERTA